MKSLFTGSRELPFNSFVLYPVSFSHSPRHPFSSSSFLPTPRRYSKARVGSALKIRWVADAPLLSIFLSFFLQRRITPTQHKDTRKNRDSSFTRDIKIPLFFFFFFFLRFPLLFVSLFFLSRECLFAFLSRLFVALPFFFSSYSHCKRIDRREASSIIVRFNELQHAQVFRLRKRLR